MVKLEVSIRLEKYTHHKKLLSKSKLLIYNKNCMVFNRYRHSLYLQDTIIPVSLFAQSAHRTHRRTIYRNLLTIAFTMNVKKHQTNIYIFHYCFLAFQECYKNCKYIPIDFLIYNTSNLYNIDIQL